MCNFSAALKERGVEFNTIRNIMRDAVVGPWVRCTGFVPSRGVDRVLKASAAGFQPKKFFSNLMKYKMAFNLNPLVSDGIAFKCWTIQVRYIISMSINQILYVCT